MTDSPDHKSAKAAARKAAAEARAAAHAKLADLAGIALARTGLGFACQVAGKVVSAFLPYQSEINTVPLMAKLAAEGATIALPVVIETGQPLVFRTWTPGGETVAGRWGIPVPPEDRPTVDPDVLLVPLLAFDKAGYRLGYGGGFYDRTLEKLRALKPVIAIGVAYAAQQVASVPRGPHDQPLDWILTEDGPFRPEQAA